jgi:hypothetical protein
MKPKKEMFGCLPKDVMDTLLYGVRSMSLNTVATVTPFGHDALETYRMLVRPEHVSTLELAAAISRASRRECDINVPMPADIAHYWPTRPHTSVAVKLRTDRPLLLPEYVSYELADYAQGNPVYAELCRFVQDVIRHEAQWQEVADLIAYLAAYCSAPDQIFALFPSGASIVHKAFNANHVWVKKLLPEKTVNRVPGMGREVRAVMERASTLVSMALLMGSPSATQDHRTVEFGIKQNKARLCVWDERKVPGQTLW